MKPNKELPEGWRWVNVKEIAENIQYGYTESSSKDKIGPKFLRITDIQDRAVLWEEVPYCKIEELNKNKYLLRAGDLVFARTGATVGKSFLLKGKIPEAIFASYLIRVRVKETVNVNFLSLFFQSAFYWSQITEGQVGIGQPNVNGTKLGQLVLPLPTKETQNAIVRKIEELFSELDKGIENLRIAQQQLKTYRQAVLNTLIDSNNYQTINSVIDSLDQGWSPKCENENSFDENEWAVIKTTSVQNGLFNDRENKKLPKNLKPRFQHELQSGDILITRAGPRVRVGVCCLVKHTRRRLLNCDKVYRIKVKKSQVHPAFFQYVINSPKYQAILEKNKSGINDSGLNLTQKTFLEIEIPVPKIEDQNAIMIEIEKKLSQSDKIDNDIFISLNQAEILKQSILRKAFEGKLLI